MTPRVILWRFFFIALPGVLAACGGDERDPMTPASRVTPRASPQAGAEKLAGVRCDRQQRCGRIGLDEEFHDREQCVIFMRKHASDDLSRGCREGVDEYALEWCLNEIATQDCGGINPSFERLDTYLSCGAKAICLD